MVDDEQANIEKQSGVLERIGQLRLQLYTKQRDRKQLDIDIETIKRDLYRELNSAKNYLTMEIEQVKPIDDVEPSRPAGRLRSGSKSIYGDIVSTKVGHIGSTPVLKEVLAEIVKCFMKYPVEIGVEKNIITKYISETFKLDNTGGTGSLATSLNAHLRYMVDRGVIERVKLGHYKWLGKKLPDGAESYVPNIEAERNLQRDVLK